MSKRLELFELIGILARRRYQAAGRAFSPLGLNHTEARLLTILHRESGEATQDLLSTSLSVDRSNAGRALKSLEQRGYVSRRKDDADSRTFLVQLTAAGQKAVIEVSRLRSELARTFFEDLTETESSAVVDLLRKVPSFDEGRIGSDRVG